MAMTALNKEAREGKKGIHNYKITKIFWSIVSKFAINLATAQKVKPFDFQDLGSLYSNGSEKRYLCNCYGFSSSHCYKQVQ